MKKEDIIKAYTKIRAIDNTIPDHVLDFMKDAVLEKLSKITYETPESFKSRTDDEILSDIKNGLSFGMK